MRISDWSSDVCSSDLHSAIIIGAQQISNQIIAHGSVGPPMLDDFQRIVVKLLSGLERGLHDQSHLLSITLRTDQNAHGAGSVFLSQRLIFGKYNTIVDHTQWERQNERKSLRVRR